MNPSLSKLQRSFLEAHIKASKLDYYKMKKVSLKGKFLDKLEDVTSLDRQLDQWVLKEVLHGEEGSKPYQCHCGRRVRHLYLVEHVDKAVVIHLGSTCYKSYVGIDAAMVEAILVNNKVLVDEQEEIIQRYEVGYIERQKFLLDYEGLEDLFREQLMLGLPLSKRQEDQAFKDLDIEDKALLVSRRDLIGQMSRQQLIKLNGLTKTGRKTIIARLVDGRILGVLDQVLEAAPELFANKGSGVDVGRNILQERLSMAFRQAKAQPIGQRIADNYKDIDLLIQMVEAGVVEPSVMIKLAGDLLSEEQREYWRGHTSGRQKRELAKYILLDRHKVAPDRIRDKDHISKDLRGQIGLELPLTEAQQIKLEAQLGK